MKVDRTISLTRRPCKFENGYLVFTDSGDTGRIERIPLSKDDLEIQVGDCVRMVYNPNFTPSQPIGFIAEIFEAGVIDHRNGRAAVVPAYRIKFCEPLVHRFTSREWPTLTLTARDIEFNWKGEQKHESDHD